VFPPTFTPKQLSAEEKQQLKDDVKSALYASKICSYAQVRLPCVVVTL
jgi:6-phosphogluconate dehydrogenase